jgi:hypothetical protein
MGNFLSGHPPATSQEAHYPLAPHMQQLQHHQEMLAAFWAQQQQRHGEMMLEADVANQQQTAQQAAQEQGKGAGSLVDAVTAFLSAPAAGSAHYVPSGTAEVKTKAVICPLFSFSRPFKQMEHLRQHLRTHLEEGDKMDELAGEEDVWQGGIGTDLGLYGGPAGAGLGMGIGGGVGGVGAGSTRLGVDIQSRPK